MTATSWYSSWPYCGLTSTSYFLIAPWKVPRSEAVCPTLGAFLISGAIFSYGAFNPCAANES